MELGFEKKAEENRDQVGENARKWEKMGKKEKREWVLRKGRKSLGGRKWIWGWRACRDRHSSRDPLSSVFSPLVSRLFVATNSVFSLILSLLRSNTDLTEARLVVKMQCGSVHHDLMELQNIAVGLIQNLRVWLKRYFLLLHIKKKKLV